MPIENLSGVVRLPRLGKIRLGEKAHDGQYPKALDYFRVEEDGGITSEKAASAFHNVYGEKPKTLDIMFPVEEVEKFFPQFYTAYTKKGKLCQGDGKIAKRWTSEDDTRQLVDIPCRGLECDWYLAKKCRRLATLQFILLKVPGLGVWHISTTSRNSIININSGVALIRGLTGERVSFIPLKLSLKEIEVPGSDGYLRKIHVLNLADEDICFSDILQAMNTSPIHALLPDPKEDPRPDDLYPDSVVEDATFNQQPVDAENPARQQFFEKMLAWIEKQGYVFSGAVREEVEKLTANLLPQDFKGLLVEPSFSSMCNAVEFIAAKKKPVQESVESPFTPGPVATKVKITDSGKLENYQGKTVRVAQTQDGRKIVLSPSLKVEPGLELIVNGKQIFSKKSQVYIIWPQSIKIA